MGNIMNIEYFNDIIENNDRKCYINEKQLINKEIISITDYYKPIINIYLMDKITQTVEQYRAEITKPYNFLYKNGKKTTLYNKFTIKDISWISLDHYYLIQDNLDNDYQLYTTKIYYPK